MKPDRDGGLGRRELAILCHDAGLSDYDIARAYDPLSLIACYRHHKLDATMRVDTKPYSGKGHYRTDQNHWQKYRYIQRDSSKFKYRASRSHQLHELHSGYLTHFRKSYDIMLIRPSLHAIHIIHPQAHIIIIRTQ